MTIILYRKKAEMSECLLCKLNISERDSFTRLDCSHTFHAACLHLRIAHMYAYCPLCIKSAPVNGTFTDLKPLDFGDDWNVLDYNSKFRVWNTMQSHQLSRQSISDVPLFLDGNDQYHDSGRSRSKIIPVYPLYGKNTTPEQKESSFFAKFAEIQERESRYGYSIEIDPLILIGNRTSSVDIRFEKHIDMMTIVKNGIKIEFILSHGYNLLDLKILDASLRHLVQIGFNSDIWKKYRQSLPYVDTIRHFGLRFGDVFNLICQSDIERFAWLEFTAEEMLITGTTAVLLVMQGLNKTNISLLNIDMEGWAKMGMSFHMLRDELGMTRLDLRNILKWTREPEIDVAFQSRFETLFKHKFVELEKGTEEYYINHPAYK